ncbi:hypothetical protein QFC19_003708 [Naganishia cerealis]|uniref:Uncharacterized protein n=1 Tax=Naganishia cerealis TaxID=610337 RepID=A0ACC2W1Z1_9TREE|nr:hypothetical protein QFC19_003708 [Naganishia cerealis]
MLPVSSILNSLLARSRAYAQPLSRAKRTPFVQPETLSSPTDRLIALAQSINLEVSLDNEDPSFGMGTGSEGDTVSATPLNTNAASTRVDTLALAGQRMVIDIEIAHPCTAKQPNEQETGWMVNSLRVERVDPEHLNPTTAGEGMDVDHPPSTTNDLITGGGALPGTRLLEEQSQVLRHYLQRYLDAVNLYNDTERYWHTHHATLHSNDEAEDTGESLELRAERAAIVFSDQLANLRAIDLKMQPLDALLGATTDVPSVSNAIQTDVNMDAAKPNGRDQVVLWDQLNDIHSLLKASVAFLSVSQGPSILPTFRPFSEDTFLVNPICRIVLSETATAARFSDISDTEYTGWAIAIDEPVLVSKGFFARIGTNGAKVGRAGPPLPEKGIEDLCGVDHSRSYTFRGSSGIRQDFLFPHSWNAGMVIDYIGIQSKEDILSTSKALRSSIWISHLLRSCTAHPSEDPTAAQEENLDEELDRLLTSGKFSLVNPKSITLNISFPITVASIQTQNPVMLNLAIEPNSAAGKVHIAASVDGSGDAHAQEQIEGYLKGRMMENELGDRLIALKGDVPQWLDALCTDLFG